MKLEGVYSVLPTPFTNAGDVDVDGLCRLVDFFVKAGVNGVTALGVTGEVARDSTSVSEELSWTQSWAESMDAFR